MWAGLPMTAPKALHWLQPMGDIRDYEGVDRSARPQLPMIAINSTAGTASEITRFCIITDRERHVKMAIVGVYAGIPENSVTKAKDNLICMTLKSYVGKHIILYG